MTDVPSESPFSGLTVLELGHIVAGPTAGLIFADLGANVIKIEQPHIGDASRNMPNNGSAFYFLNRNKRSLALDLKTPEGHHIFEQLIASADVVIDNFGPDQMARWGIDYEWAKTINEQVIYCSIKGFLPGPYQSRPFLDELAQMSGGLAYMTGPAGQPLRSGASIVDIGAATYAVLGVLTALLERHATGKGKLVTSGLFETTVFWVGQHITRTQITGTVPDPFPVRAMGGQMGWGVYQIFTTSDNRQIFIAITSNRHWAQFCQVMGLTEWIDDPNFKTNAQRVAAHDIIISRITEIISEMNFDQISTLLAEENLPYAPVNTPRDLLDDPHLQYGDHWLHITTEETNEIRVPTLPIAMVGQHNQTFRQPPRLGEHTQEILLGLGYTNGEIEKLEMAGRVESNGSMLGIEKATVNNEVSR